MRRTLNIWLATAHLSLQQVENVEFRNFVKACHPAINKLSLSRNTVKSWIIDELLYKKEQIKQSLHDAASLINFTFDLWTSPNHYSIFGLTVHYFDSKFVLTTCFKAYKVLSVSINTDHLFRYMYVESRSLIAVIVRAVGNLQSTRATRCAKKKKVKMVPSGGVPQRDGNFLIRS